MRNAQQRTLYCTPVEKATIQAAAVKPGDPVSRFVIASRLRNATILGKGPVGEALALTGEEQRSPVEGMERLTALDAALREPLPGIGVTALEALRGTDPEGRNGWRAGRTVRLRRRGPSWSKVLP